MKHYNTYIIQLNSKNVNITAGTYHTARAVLSAVHVVSASWRVGVWVSDDHGWVRVAVL